MMNVTFTTNTSKKIQCLFYHLHFGSDGKIRDRRKVGIKVRVKIWIEENILKQKTQQN